MNFSQLRVKREPVEQEYSVTMAEDEQADAYDDAHDPTTVDPDEDRDDKKPIMAPPPPRQASTAAAAVRAPARSRTTVAVETPAVGGAMVRNVVLTPSAARVVPLVDARAALPHTNKVFNLDAYDQPAAASAGRAAGERVLSDSTQSAAAFVNYIVARTAPGGPAIRSTESGGGNSIFINEMMRAPPSRWMPASDSPAAKMRLDAVVLDRAQFNELTRTPRPGDVPCAAGRKCESLHIRNAHGARINNTPWVAMWFAHERALFEGPDAAKFRAKLEERQCVQCEMILALRMSVTCASTCTAVNAAHNPRAAVGWYVLVNRDGEFPQSATIGPDANYYNALIGQVPLAKINGWRVRPTSNTSCVEFVAPIPEYPPPDNAATRDGTLGF
jgi:hypothetical protein